MTQFYCGLLMTLGLLLGSQVASASDDLKDLTGIIFTCVSNGNQVTAKLLKFEGASQPSTAYLTVSKIVNGKIVKTNDFEYISDIKFGENGATSIAGSRVDPDTNLKSSFSFSASDTAPLTVTFELLGKTYPVDAQNDCEFFF